MGWLVIDVIYLGEASRYMLILHAGTLKMMSEVTSKSLIQPGDILYTVSDAMYLINKNENQRLKITSASAFSATQWCFLKNHAKALRSKQNYRVKPPSPTCASAYHFINSAVPGSFSAGAHGAISCSATGW
jgi:signal transduction protein PmrD